MHLTIQYEVLVQRNSSKQSFSFNENFFSNQVSVLTAAELHWCYLHQLSADTSNKNLLSNQHFYFPPLVQMRVSLVIGSIMVYRYLDTGLEGLHYWAACLAVCVNLQDFSRRQVKLLPQSVRLKTGPQRESKYLAGGQDMSAGRSRFSWGGLCCSCLGANASPLRHARWASHLRQR